ncbi:MAG: FAD-dependent thymidylate synthase [Bryobacterales bacterium]|nr:FAD-dependent thymidylate synthase [Bryobacterales bacterium]
MPPEKCAFALARYSRSPDSIRESLEWVRTHDSAKFLESFYFQYGHASIADLGHLVLCFEGISELAATEIEDEQLWDGQARSSRYQDFSNSGFVTPPEFDPAQAAVYLQAAGGLLAAYKQIHAKVFDHLAGTLAQPATMTPEAYRRNLNARAFDVARYLLCFGIPTGVGQVTSIRTLERQVRRLKASEYAELRSLANEIAEVCAAGPCLRWEPNAASDSFSAAVAPTLARHLDPDEYAQRTREDLDAWALQNLAPSKRQEAVDDVDLIKPSDTLSDIVATLLYPVTDWPYRELYETACSWSEPRRHEVIDLALMSKTRRDELSRHFRAAPYVFDIVMDIGAYRDLHRHRRCQQFRQSYSAKLGYETPRLIEAAGLAELYHTRLSSTYKTAAALRSPGSHYLLPFATRSRFLFKMDFAEAEYIARLRSGVKGHFSYRKIAWEVKQKMSKLEPELGRLMEATPPWVEDPLQR